MKSIFDVLSKGNEQIALVRETLVETRAALARFVEAYPDLADEMAPRLADLDAKIATLDAPMDAPALLALGAVVFTEIKGFARLEFTPTPHAGSGI